MKANGYVMLLIMLVYTATFSQSINDYKYVVVPIKFDFLKENDQFRLSTNTKLMLQKYGFTSYLSTDDIPLEIRNNSCSYATAFIEENNNMFVTKIKIVLKDCQQRILFETEFGTSRIKKLAPAYTEALRMASKSFDALHYKFNGSSNTTVVADTPVSKQAPKNAASTTAISSSDTEMFYFAQPTATGFQVIDNEPKVIMKLYNTSQKNVFQAVKGTLNGTVLAKDGQWFFEYYENDTLVSEKINLKF